MTTALLFYGHFVASKVGKTGLTPTVDIDKIEKATGTVTAVVTGGSASEGRRGYYLYRLANATPVTHDYVAIFITADSSVDQQQVAATRVDFTEARAAELAYLDAAISSRNATPPLDATATQAAAAAALAAYDPATGAEVAALPVPPSASDVADAVRLELAVEMARIDAVVSSRLAGDDYVTPLDSTATQAAVSSVLDAYDPPTKTEMDMGIAGVASAVRSELSAELAMLDVEVSSRLASADYTPNDADPFLNPITDYPSNTMGAIVVGNSGRGITIVNPVAQTGNSVQVVYGDDYKAADGRALMFLSLPGAVLTGSTVVMKIKSSALGITTLPAVVTGAHDCMVDVASTVLTTIGVGIFAFDIESTNAEGSVATMARGYFNVEADVRS
jgi:hypothetical protein